MVRNPILDVHHQIAGLAGGVVHGLRERKKPLDIVVRVDAAVAALVGIGRAGEEQRHASSGQLWDQAQ